MKKKSYYKQLFLLSILFLVGSLSVFAQTNPTPATDNTSYSTKTMRALFPNTAVAIANEIHGGLHVVNNVNDLHGTGNGALKLDNNNLQVGMLVWVQSAQMYYRYKGAAANGTPNVGNTTPIPSQDTNGVSKIYWQALTDILKLPENITVIEDCTNNFKFHNGTKDTINNFPPTAKIKKDGIGNGVDISSDTPNPGDHLILMPKTGNQPIAVYVYDGTATTPVWRLVSVGDRAEVVDSADLTKDPEDNSYAPDNYNQGDIIKLVNGNANITYVLNNNNEWEEISRNVSGDIIAYPVFIGNYDLDGTSGTSGTSGTPATESITTTQLTTTFISKEDFLSQMNNTAGKGYAMTGKDDGVVIEYPAIWGNFIFSISTSTGVYELTNGTLIEIIDKDHDNNTSTPAIKYKRVRVACRDNTIYLN